MIPLIVLPEAFEVKEQIRHISRVPGSFRDPAGALYKVEGNLYRTISPEYLSTFRQFADQGLYDSLISERWIVQHSEIEPNSFALPGAGAVISPEIIPFISYPYEWCFSALKEAALLSLSIEDRALDFGMTLKDASAFNVQFMDGRPIFIDTLSFDLYIEGEPWKAYGQFCEHFLAPLLLQHYLGSMAQPILNNQIAGVPLALCSRVLPLRSWLSFGALTHCHFHSRFRKAEVRKERIAGQKVSKFRRKALVDSLRSLIEPLSLPRDKSFWSGYYNQELNYEDESFKQKQVIVEEALSKIVPKRVVDLGANIGKFSEIAALKGIFTVSVEQDPLCVEIAYNNTRSLGIKNLLPLIGDLTNPSPALGWHCGERESIIERIEGDLVLALALIHHLAIGNNLPFELIAQFLGGIADYLLIEFVPREDSQTQRLLQFREDLFQDYNEDNFLRDFGKYFELEKRWSLSGSSRIIFLFKSH